MSQLAVVTPTYGPDAPLFADLHRSVLEFTDATTVHHVIVPASDRSYFMQYEGPRCRIATEPELLPTYFRRMPKSGWWLSFRRPWPPVRGWVLQQALKMAATAQLDVDNVIIMDSDVVFVRPVEASRFTVGDQRCLHRLDDGVRSDMSRHLIWHQVARTLLGLPKAPPPPLPDYVSSLSVWEPRTMRAIQRRISEVTGRPWLDAVTRELHVSEFMLYGIYVDEIASAGRARPPADSTLCHDYWEQEPLDLEEALAFADRLPPDAIGMMISSKSRTPAPVRRAVLARCAEIAGSGGRPRPLR